MKYRSDRHRKSLGVVLSKALRRYFTEYKYNDSNHCGCNCRRKSGDVGISYRIDKPNRRDRREGDINYIISNQKRGKNLIVGFCKL